MDKLHTCSKSVESLVHFDFSNITHVATKVHMIIRMYVVVTWMCDNREFSEECYIMEQCRN
jgi:hypothetical protein